MVSSSMNDLSQFVVATTEPEVEVATPTTLHHRLDKNKNSFQSRAFDQEEVSIAVSIDEYEQQATSDDDEYSQQSNSHSHYDDDDESLGDQDHDGDDSCYTSEGSMEQRLGGGIAKYFVSGEIQKQAQQKEKKTIIQKQHPQQQPIIIPQQQLPKLTHLQSQTLPPGNITYQNNHMDLGMIGFSDSFVVTDSEDVSEVSEQQEPLFSSDFETDQLTGIGMDHSQQSYSTRNTHKSTGSGGKRTLMADNSLNSQNTTHADVLSFDIMLGKKAPIEPQMESSSRRSSGSNNNKDYNEPDIDDQDDYERRHRRSISRQSSIQQRRQSRRLDRSTSSRVSRHSDGSRSRSTSTQRSNRSNEGILPPPSLMPMSSTELAAHNQKVRDGHLDDDDDDDEEDIYSVLAVASGTVPVPPPAAAAAAALDASDRIRRRRQSLGTPSARRSSTAGAAGPTMLDQSTNSQASAASQQRRRLDGSTASRRTRLSSAGTLDVSANSAGTMGSGGGGNCRRTSSLLDSSSRRTSLRRISSADGSTTNKNTTTSPMSGSRATRRTSRLSGTHRTDNNGDPVEDWQATTKPVAGSMRRISSGGRRASEAGHHHHSSAIASPEITRSMSSRRMHDHSGRSNTGISRASISGGSTRPGIGRVASYDPAAGAGLRRNSFHVGGHHAPEYATFGLSHSEQNQTANTAEPSRVSLIAPPQDGPNRRERRVSSSKPHDTAVASKNPNKNSAAHKIRNRRMASERGMGESSRGGMGESSRGSGTSDLSDDYWDDEEDEEDPNMFPFDPFSNTTIDNSNGSSGNNHNGTGSSRRQHPNHHHQVSDRVSRRKSGLTRNAGSGDGRNKVRRCRSEPTETLHMIMHADIDEDTVAAMQHDYSGDRRKVKTGKRPVAAKGSLARLAADKNAPPTTRASRKAATHEPSSARRLSRTSSNS